MIIRNISFPFYGIIIVLSILIGNLYVYLNTKKKLKFDQFILYFMLYIVFAFYFGKLYTYLVYNTGNFFTAGLSSYGGLFGVIISAIIFEKFFPTNKDIIRYSIISLSLVYGISKIACFISGCCGGIPYSGILKIKYVDALNIWQFPIQLVEVITSILIFIICNIFRNNKNINYISLILIVVLKFFLDFLRYDHVKILISRNQIFSIVVLIITLGLFIKIKLNKNRVSK